MKVVLRFALVTIITMLLTPRLSRVLQTGARQLPSGSFLEEVLVEISNNYAKVLVQSFGRTVGELLLGS